MENDRLIAEISKREDAEVDKVASRKIMSSPLVARMQRAEELRKKTVHVEGLSKLRFCKLKIQESFELIQKTLHFEYGENMELHLKSNEIEIYSRWVEGVTLFDSQKKEPPYKINDVIRLRNRLRLWVRIFEHLSFYHSKGILHGNLKPQNILIRDKSNFDMKQSYESEFLAKQEDIPHVVLLDGGYFHFIPNNVKDFQKRSFEAKTYREQNYWLAPEVRGFLEGSYSEASDIFSLASIMAWDLGLLKEEGFSILNALWPLFVFSDPNNFMLGSQCYRWNTKHVVFEALKNLRNILLKALNPLCEERSITARDFASEIMMLSNKISESPESQNLVSFVTLVENDFDEKLFHSILIKNFDIPEQISEFVLEKNKVEGNRFWIDTKTKSANKYSLMRKLNAGLNILNKSTFYHAIKFSSMKVPFFTLDNFCQNLLSHTLFFNPLFLQDLKTIFFNLGSQVDALYYVLPCLKKYGDSKSNFKKTNKNNLIQVKHESLNINIEKIFDKILNASKISTIILDDLNRADQSSLPILISFLKKHSQSIKWVIGLRSEEEILDEESLKQINHLKHIDPYYSHLKEDRSKSYWVAKLNNLTSQQARLLSTWAMVDLQIDTDFIELISSKISEVSEIFSDKYHEGKQNIIQLDNLPKDLILEETNVGQEKDAKNVEDEDEDKKKDPLHLAYEALNIAIKVGLVSENRDIFTGHLICYYWENQFIWLSLSLLLNKSTKSKIYYILAEYMSQNIVEKLTLSEIVHIAEYLARSHLKQCAYSAYCALLVASEELCDISSAEFIISRLQMLGESIEKECPEDAPVLIPRIREDIADLSRSLGKLEQAEKYYQAVSWNTVNQKRKIILSMKSFFPSQIKKREKRTEGFLNIVKQAEKLNLLTNFYQDSDFSYKEEIENEVYKIQKKLTEQENFLDKEEHNNIEVLLKNFMKTEQVSFLNKTEKSQIFPKLKPVRGSVVAQLLRACIGWIDNEIVFPHILKIMKFTIENDDGESTIHLLFSLLLCGERNITPKLRSLILETITDLSGRIGSDLSLYEALLLKAWCSLFFDGNILECKKNIDKINSSSSGELPSSLRQCAYKLQMLAEFESLSFESIKNHGLNIQRYLKKMQEYGLMDWGIGGTIFSIQQTTQPTLKVIPGDELFLGNILEEKTDQILLFTHFLFERGHGHAATLVAQEAKDLRIRPWFSDSFSHIEYFPEKMALKIIEYTELKNKIYGGAKKSKKADFILKTNSLWNNVFYWKKKNLMKYWGEDKALQENVKAEKASTQDTEKLNFLAQNALRAGLHWTAYRLAHKARCDLSLVMKEMKEIESALKNVHLEWKDLSSRDSSLPSLTKEEIVVVEADLNQKSGTKKYENSEPYPEQGIAMNYVLEFLHNFQNHIHAESLTQEELQKISHLIKKSIPEHTDIVESTMAGALRAFSKRILFSGHGPHDESKPELTNEEKTSENKELKQVS